jgi:DNA-binding MarR family transcriptional regulator
MQWLSAGRQRRRADNDIVAHDNNSRQHQSKSRAAIRRRAEPGVRAMAGRTAAVKKSELSAAKPAANGKAAPAPAPAPGGEKVLNLGVLDGHLGYFLRRVQVWVFQDFIKTLASVDLRPAQYSVLAVIGANRGLSQADVAQFLGIERARLVRLLHRLEKRGLTQRLASPNDRRSHALQLTSAGQALLKRAKTLAGVHEANLMQRFGATNHARTMEALRDFDARR